MEVRNNKGFSLLEVLIAIVILCVVSIPLLHAFVTASRTNARSKVVLRATSVAEDLMEDFKYLTVEELETKYGSATLNTVTFDDTTGKYEFIIKNPSQFSQDLPDDYSVKMTLNPNLYTNANALNLSEFSTVSAADSAVYVMQGEYDNRIYEQFLNKNEEWNAVDPTSYTKKNLDFFKNNLIRTIVVSIVKKGTGEDVVGDEMDLATVTIKVKYELKNYSGILPRTDAVFEEKEAEMFNNQLSNTRLNSVFVLYNPRYAAAASVKGDNIVIENADNIKTNVYVIAQDNAMIADASLKTGYLSTTNGLILSVIESPDPSGFPTSTKSALTIRTNLCEEAPYTSLETEMADVKCKLIYRNLTGSLKAEDTQAQKVLHAGDVAGKALDSSQTSVRIYKIVTQVLDGDDDVVVSLDGTRLN